MLILMSFSKPTLLSNFAFLIAFHEARADRDQVTISTSIMMTPLDDAKCRVLLDVRLQYF